MKGRIVSVLFLSMEMLLPGLGAPAGKELNSSAPAGCDSARVRFRLAEKTLRPSVTFRFGNGETRARGDTPCVMFSGAWGHTLCDVLKNDADGVVLAR